MTTTPLPPLPYTEHGLCFFDEGGARPCDGDGYTADQMQAYALAARADLEAENMRLMENLRRCEHFIQEQGYVLDYAARTALEKQP